jgi:predicted membrane-bound spermidine synthase
LINQVVLVVSAVVAVCAIVYGLAAGESDSWISGVGAAIISMLSVIGLLLARLGSDLKYAGRI